MNIFVFGGILMGLLCISACVFTEMEIRRARRMLKR